MEDENERRLDRVKRHLTENKKTYLIGAGCLAAGYFLRRPGIVAPVFNNSVAPVISPVIEIVNTVNNGGHMRKIVRCLETGQMWPSMTKAAEAAGVTLEKMSKHLHGYKDHVNELHYVIEGLAA